MNDTRTWLRSLDDARWVPLFETGDSLEIETFLCGRNDQLTLMRNELFDEAMIDVIERGLSSADFRGLLYVMAWGERDRLYPLYIGKAGRFGHDGRTTSGNLKRIHTTLSKFARWGYGNAYHIGDLSQVLFGWESSQDPSPKYEAWAEMLFKSRNPPVLREQVSVLLIPWYESSIGILGDVCTVEDAEEQLIAQAFLEFPDTVLNVAGEVWWNPQASTRASSEPMLRLSNEVRWINSQDRLEQLGAELEAYPVIALDVETTLYPSKLALLQVGTPDFNAVVDPFAVDSLAPISRTLGSNDTIKIIHNASFERRILGEEGLQIRRVFDTLKKSRTLRANQKSHTLADVSRRELQRSLSKRPQTSDWTRRPLSEAQLNYAALDVEVLLRLYDVFAPETEPSLPLLDMPALPGMGHLNSADGADEVALIVVGCVKTKRDQPAPAKDLYTSSLFKKRRRYAEKRGVPWVIASAKEPGFIEIDEVLAPYDRVMGKLRKVERENWVAAAIDKAREILPQFNLAHGVQVEVHAGAPYVAAVRQVFDELRPDLKIVAPLKALRKGEQEAWYLDRDPPDEVESHAPSRPRRAAASNARARTGVCAEIRERGRQRWEGDGKPTGTELKAMRLQLGKELVAEGFNRSTVSRQLLEWAATVDEAEAPKKSHAQRASRTEPRTNPRGGVCAQIWERGRERWQEDGEPVGDELRTMRLQLGKELVDEGFNKSTVARQLLEWAATVDSP